MKKIKQFIKSERFKSEMRLFIAVFVASFLTSEGASAIIAFYQRGMTLSDLNSIWIAISTATRDGNDIWVIFISIGNAVVSSAARAILVLCFPSLAPKINPKV